MLIIGCDFHPGFQQVAIFDKRTGEMQEKRLQHRAEAEQFYGALAGQAVRVGMEACGHYPWFERLLAELGIELWLGDAARVRASVVRRQKTDRRDAEHLLDLLLQDRFPRIWVPSLEVRVAAVAGASAQAGAGADAHQESTAGHGAKLRGAEETQAVDGGGASGVGAVALAAYAAQRRKRLLETLDSLEAEIGELDRGVAEEARQRPEAVRSMTYPGVGAVTALAMVLTLGPAERFESGKQVGSYFGLIPSEDSSGGKQRLGKISKQGSSFLRFLLVEAGQKAARLDPQLKRFYRRLAGRKNRSIAKVAVARKLATRLYLMLREDWTYAQLCQAVMQVSPSHSVAGQ